MPEPCAECGNTARPNSPYCSQLCRNADDRHDALDYRTETADA